MLILLWSDLLKPGRRVEVKMKDEVVEAVIENLDFVSKLSFYFYEVRRSANWFYLKLSSGISVRDITFDLVTRSCKFSVFPLPTAPLVGVLNRYMHGQTKVAQQYYCW